MLFPEYLQTALDTALLEVQTHPEHQLSADTRIEIYTAFCEYGSEHLWIRTPVRGYLALITARRVIHHWDDISHQIYEHIDKGNFNYDDKPLSDYQKVHYLSLMGCEDFLGGFISLKMMNTISDLLYYICGNLPRYVADLIDVLKPSQQEIDLLWQKTNSVSACYKVAHEVMGFRYYRYTMLKNGEMIIEDVAYLAMKSECGKDKTKTLKFWTWWLTEAIPQAWEQVHGAEDIDDSW